MTRGQRDGQLTKKDFIARLVPVVAAAANINNVDLVEAVLQECYTRDELFGFCAEHKLLNELEYEESCPKLEHTIPCYLYTHVADQEVRNAIEHYVLASSLLYQRGSAIINGIEACIAARAFVDNTTSHVDVWSRHDAGNDLDTLVAFLSEENDIKHAFLPERWPTDKTPRNALVDVLLHEHGDAVAHLLPPTWQTLMPVSGWDNVLNRMATKYRVAVQNMVTTGLHATTAKYLVTVATRLRAFDMPTEGELEAFQAALAGTVRGCLRPLTISDDDFELLIALRTSLGCVPRPGRVGKVTVGADALDDDPVLSYPPKHVAFTPATLKLHLFCRRVIGAKTLPEVARGRHYTYLDAKIFGALITASRETRKKRPIDTDASTGVSALAALLRLTRDSFNAARTRARQAIRKRTRRRYGKDAAERERIRLRRTKWNRLGKGLMANETVFHSVETDGVGLRIVIKRHDAKAIAAVKKPFDAAMLLDVAQYARDRPSVPAADVAKAVKKSANAAIAATKRAAKKNAKSAAKAGIVEAMEALKDDQGREPAFGGGDNGRAKLTTFAVTTSALRRPDTVTLTRKRYYAAMKFHKRRRWEKDRVQGSVQLRTAMAALAQAGMVTATSTPSRHVGAWRARLEAEATHHQVLYSEYVVDKERALWKMRMMRAKRSCLDMSMSRVVRTATGGDKTRNLVLGIGNAGFPCTGPGELPAPTSALTQALRRVKVRRDLLKGAGKTVITAVNEDYTTKCCANCCKVTTPPLVKDAKLGKSRPSRRLRLCTMCNDTADKLRDRDVQAARNILWLTIYKYYGLERPEYLCRSAHRTVTTTACNAATAKKPRKRAASGAASTAGDASTSRRRT